MKMDWTRYVGKTLNVTMNENYGVVYNDNPEQPVFYEIVFKTGILKETNEDGIILDHEKKEGKVQIFIPYASIKCVEVYGVE